MMKKSSFAMKFQTVLIFLLLATFVMMMQPQSELIFRIGVITLIFCALLQIAVGNIDLSYDANRWVKALVKILAIVAVVFAISMTIIPLFLNKDFVRAFLWVLILGTIAAFTVSIIRGTSKPKNKER